MHLLVIFLFSIVIKAAHQEIKDTENLVRQCFECGVEKTDIKQCMQCKKVFYCSETCQKKAWKNHHQRICCNLDLIAKDDEFVCKFYGGYDARDMTQQEFKLLTKKIYARESLFSKAQKQKASQTAFENACVEELAKDSVALCLEDDNRGFGLIALRDIKAQEILATFGGEAIPITVWEKERHTNQTRCCVIQMEDFILDPSRYTSLAAYINDGPPNCELVNLSLAKGQKSNAGILLEKYAIAITDIKKGDFIYTDYCFDNSIKQSPYSYCESALTNFASVYEQALDFSSLDKMGLVTNSFVNFKIDSDSLSVTKLNYILATPHINLMLHTKFGLDPIKTLESLSKLKKNKKNEYIWQHIEEAKTLLSALAKIKVQDRNNFANSTQKISQKSLIILSTFIEKQNSPISVENLAILAYAIEKLIFMVHGTNNGTYWSCLERDSFEPKYFRKEHQRELNDDSIIEKLPIEYGNFYRNCRNHLQESLYRY